MPLVKCQINNSPAGRVPSSDRPRAPQSRGDADHCALCRWKESQWREQMVAVPAPLPRSLSPCPARRSLASGLATGPGSTNMWTYSKPSWLPRSLLPPSAQSYYLELKRGRGPSEALVV